MKFLLFFSSISSFVLLFLIIYAWTLPLFPKDWNERVNSNTKSLNPKLNNNAITGAIIIILSSLVLILWSVFLYLNLFYLPYITNQSETLFSITNII